jgi:hypothetical protein
MRENLDQKSDPDLSFQLFTSPQGVTMDYPGSILGLNYDGRLDNWYKGATSPPKDIVFIVDKSGSMEGGKYCGMMTSAVSQVCCA